MTKFLKLRLCSVYISIKLTHLMLIQRMFNTFTNTIVRKHSADKIVISEDLSKNVSVFCNANKAEKASEESVNYNKKQVNLEPDHNILVPDENCFHYNNHLFQGNPYNNQFQQCMYSNQDQGYIYRDQNPQAYQWPFYNFTYFCYPPYHNQYWQNKNSFYSSVRNFHTQQVHRKKIKKDNYKSKLTGVNIMSLRLWETICEKPSSTPGFIFTVMSYNVLAQDLVEQHPYLYSEHDSRSLHWYIRWQNIFREISQFKPEILCFQEVQESHRTDYYSTLHALGYESIFKKRTGSQSDGCAIYYLSDKVTVLEHSLVEFFQPGISVLNRDNVGIVAKFAPKLHPTREFVVATTHLLYNPRRDDVRMAQMHLLLTDIEKMSYKKDGVNLHYLPIILTGDLNSPPYSDLYQFITRGKIKYEHLASVLKTTNQETLVTSCLGITDNSEYLEVVQKRLSESVIIDLVSEDDAENCDESFKKDCKKSKTLSHNFGLKSVYDHGSERYTEGTTFQDEWLTVDYIFYSVKKQNKIQSDKLKLLSRYRLPTSQELQGLRIPNAFIGSDHLSLIAKFKLEF